MEDAMESETVSTKQQRIAELARIHPEVSFTSLAYHIDMEWLKEAYRRTRKSGAVGVDRETAQEYGKDLENNLKSLLERMKSGKYIAPPVRRVQIPKDGKGKETRPIGVPTFEDKVAQRAVHMVLEPLYEQEFLDCSYGFRPKRSAHDALEGLWQQAMGIGGGWIIDLDIRKFFDSMSHRHIREILKRRVCDGVVRRLMGKWLKAGVMEKGQLSYPEEGSPQGGVISPMISNVYLHEVLDKWFDEVVKPRMRGTAFMIRYADDAVLVFSRKEDAQRVMEVLPKRFAKYGLTVHPQKTRIVEFSKPVSRERREGPRAFSFLGFSHYWAKSRKGNWHIRRKTDKSRFTRALGAITGWCKKHRHSPLRKQQRMLTLKLRGHYAYYGITGNMEWIARFREEVRKAWRKWLDRRSRGRDMPWERFERLEKRYSLPVAKIVHSYCTAKL
jgi:group II intron reverse transcriptase/maturase